MTLVKEIDPEGNVKRPGQKLIWRTYQSPGANLSWHADEYDSLKLFGFPFCEKIDEHSRKVISIKK